MLIAFLPTDVSHDRSNTIGNQVQSGYRGLEGVEIIDGPLPRSSDWQGVE